MSNERAEFEAGRAAQIDGFASDPARSTDWLAGWDQGRREDLAVQSKGHAEAERGGTNERRPLRERLALAEPDQIISCTQGELRDLIAQSKAEERMAQMAQREDAARLGENTGHAAPAGGPASEAIKELAAEMARAANPGVNMLQMRATAVSLLPSLVGKFLDGEGGLSVKQREDEVLRLARFLETGAFHGEGDA